MHLPNTIRNDLRNFSPVETIKGRLNDQIIKFINKKQELVYLKIGEGISVKSIEQEIIVLNWLKNKNIVVPCVINFATENGKTYLLITSVEGVPSHKIKNQSKKDILRVVAEALLNFHKLDMHDCEKLNTIDKDLSEIRSYIDLKVINIDCFKKANNGKTPEDVFNYLKAAKNKLSNNVITHGDYCLPNLIITKTGYGFIDLGDCGLGDKYKDFSSLEVSIKRNYGQEWIGTFYQYYNRDMNIDKTKIKYYQFIDQFDYNLNIKKYNRLHN